MADLPRRLTVERPHGPLRDFKRENVGPQTATAEWNAGQGRPLAEAAALPEEPGLSGPSEASGAVESFTPDDIELRVPAGMHPPGSLAELLQSGDLFTGLVISIGFSAKDPQATRNPEIEPAVAEFVAGLLRKSDYGCRVDHHEFLIICPGSRAAEAQRHLSHVSERLWDYKLRALGKSPLVFNMGGTEVLGESLSDAIASAKHRMNQSRREPKAPSLSLVTNRKKAV
ncbi:MAG: hypothetical protein M3Z32_11850 [Acidobacteriota bacterium]|nr:hypothetical protein [Acidobacteriota bacterium]